MRTARVPIAGRMALVLVLGVNLAMIREPRLMTSSTLLTCFLGSVPMVDALVLCCFPLGLGLWRGGGCRLSLASFAAGGA